MRHYVRQTLDSWNAPTDDAVLIASELATNAITHGRDGVVVSIVQDRAGTLIEIHDDNPNVPVTPTRDTAALGGRGMEIITQLARDWGIHRHVDNGKTVWARLR